MGILEQLLEEMGHNELDEQVKKLCDQISDEERENTKHSYKDPEDFEGPAGPNIFLSLSAYQYVFLCLERESIGVYVITKYSRIGEGPLKRIQAWEVKEYQANKILGEYARKLKFVRGE